MPNTYTMHDGKRITMAADQVGVSDGAPKWIVYVFGMFLSFPIGAR